MINGDVIKIVITNKHSVGNDRVLHFIVWLLLPGLSSLEFLRVVLTCRQLIFSWHLSLVLLSRPHPHPEVVMDKILKTSEDTDKVCLSRCGTGGSRSLGHKSVPSAIKGQEDPEWQRGLLVQKIVYAAGQQTRSLPPDINNRRQNNYSRQKQWEWIIHPKHGRCVCGGESAKDVEMLWLLMFMCMYG